MAIPETIPGLLTAATSADPTRPALTFYDDATGERTELSGTTLINWVSKTANMIVDESSLSYGDVASVELPPHWQSAAVLLGCWFAGLEIIFGPTPADVAFVSVAEATEGWPATDRFALGLHPFALPLKEVPSGYVDYNAEVRLHGDHFRPIRPVQPDDPALARRTHAEVCEAAAERAASLGMSGGRVLIDGDQHPDPLEWLLAPLAAGSTIVLCRNVDDTKIEGRAAAERATAVIG